MPQRQEDNSRVISSDSGTTSSNTSSTKDTQTTEEDKSKEKEPSLTSHKAKYKVASFKLISTEFKEPIELLPASVTKIIVVQDFDSLLQPVMELKVILPPLIIDYINTHRNMVSFFLTFQQQDYLSARENWITTGDFDPNTLTNVCSDKFIFFSADQTKMPNLGDYKMVAETIMGTENPNLLYEINKSGQNMINYTQEYSFFVWKESDLYNLRLPVNGVFCDCTIGDVVASILSDNGFKNVLMVPADNKETFGQLVIPPMSLMNLFEYVQSQYGMYNTDILFFSDIYRTYVIDKSGEAKAYADNEFTKTIFTIVESRSEYSKDVGSYTLVDPEKKKREYHHKVDIEHISIRSLAAMHDIIKGNTNRYVDSRNNEVTTVSGSGEQRGDGCVNMTTDQEGSEYTKKTQSNKIAEMALNLKLTYLTDYNYDAMTPNKCFIFTFVHHDFYQYNGYYRLMRATHVFTRDGQGEYMEVIGEFEFTRKKALAEDERKQIEMDVFKTAKTSEESKQEAEAQSEKTAQQSPSYNQSQNNQVAEGKMEAPAKQEAGSSAPTSVGDTTKSDNTSKTQPFNPSTDEGYKKQEANDPYKKQDKLQGSPPPKPLNEKAPLSGYDIDNFIIH